MKKILALIFVVSIILTACGQPAPTSTLPSEETSAPVATSMPEATNTPEPSPTVENTLTPEVLDPYATISADKAEFYFPLPQQEKWDWFVLSSSSTVENCGTCTLTTYKTERIWSVRVNADKPYDVEVKCANKGNESPQSGSAEEMLKTCEAGIWLVENIQSDGSYETSPTDFANISFSYSNGGVLIELSEPSLVQALYSNKPEEIEYYYTLITDFSDPANPQYDYQVFNVTPEIK